MKKLLLALSVISAGVLIFIPSSDFNNQAKAAPSCTGWMIQENGCYWRTCVDDYGRQYCEEICPGEKVARRVKCE